MFGSDALDQRRAYIDGVQRIPRAWPARDPADRRGQRAGNRRGCDLVMMCDIRVASERASFAESFVQIGLIPGDGGSWFLPRAVGPERSGGDDVHWRPDRRCDRSAVGHGQSGGTARRSATAGTRARGAHHQEPAARPADGQTPTAGVPDRIAGIDAGHGRGHADRLRITTTSTSSASADGGPSRDTAPVGPPGDCRSRRDRCAARRGPLLPRRPSSPPARSPRRWTVGCPAGTRPSPPRWLPRVGWG